jgi:N-methylhydantoinase A
VTTARIAVDIGGTFTDAVLLDEETGATKVYKVLSTPADPSEGFLSVIDEALEDAELSPAQIAYVVHATTVATNAIIEGKGERAGMILTAGFGDLMEIQRQIRPLLYDLHFAKQPALVPRELCCEVTERLDASGSVLKPLRIEDVHAAIDIFEASDIRSVAVCLLHSYINPAHEEQISEVFRARCPGISLSLSSHVCPEFREYFRASTTAINAIIRPIVGAYLDRVEEALTGRGLPGDILVMQSNGGVLTFAGARDKPVYMVESGPAAGVMAAAYIGTQIGEADVLSFDMGGTTAKAGMIRDGQPQITREFELGSIASAGALGVSKASGYPIRTPVIDLVEIGAGGGSVAWIDSGGVLRVGPASTGADPGPACYGLGGTQPTVTDANLVLGRLNPDYFLGGKMTLDLHAAVSAIKRCAEPLGMQIPAVAHGIIEIANAAMTNALRVISIQRGYDPRAFVLVGFGGAGPVHINRVAAELGVKAAIVPAHAGVASALGLLVTDLKYETSVTRITRTSEVLGSDLEQLFETLEFAGKQELIRDGIQGDEVILEREIDARYVGQSYELTIAVSGQPFIGETVESATNAFHREHRRAYGRSADDQPVEFVNFRVVAIGRIPKPRLRDLVAGRAPGGKALKGSRPVYFGEAGAFVETDIYDRSSLQPGEVLSGPAIIEEAESTVVVHPGYRVQIDSHGNIRISSGTPTAVARQAAERTTV